MSKLSACSVWKGSDGPMKNKLRKLTVAGREFRWRVVRLSEHNVCLRIWSAEDPKTPWVEMRCRSDDSWLQLGDPTRLEDSSEESQSLRSIQPGFVREIIEQVAARRGWPEAPVHCRHYALEGEAIEEIAD